VDPFRTSRIFADYRRGVERICREAVNHHELPAAGLPIFVTPDRVAECLPDQVDAGIDWSAPRVWAASIPYRKAAEVMAVFLPIKRPSPL